MAIIILKPGESFEHIHTSESWTTHVEGDLELLLDGKIIQLTNYETFFIPAMVTHTVSNTGSTIAKFDCNGHGTTGVKYF
jgi:mannose-6-phosphate isomerase-like protein (cupin superfamily)